MRIIEDPLPTAQPQPQASDPVSEALSEWLRKFSVEDADGCWVAESLRPRRFHGVFLSPMPSAAAAGAALHRDRIVPVVLAKGLKAVARCGKPGCVNPAHMRVEKVVPAWYADRMKLLDLSPKYVHLLRTEAAATLEREGPSRLVVKMVQRAFWDGHEDVSTLDMRRILRGEFYRDYPGPVLDEV